MSDEFISIKEAAKLMGVDQNTLRRWGREGRLTAVRTAGGHRRYRPSDLNKIGTMKPEEASLTINVNLTADTHVFDFGDGSLLVLTLALNNGAVVGTRLGHVKSGEPHRVLERLDLPALNGSDQDDDQ